MEISLQTQFYILYGVFAGVSVILIIWLLVLCYSVDKLRRKSKKLQDQLNQDKNDGKKSNLFAYQNPAIQPDEELAKRGYSMYDGQFVPRLESTGPGQYSGAAAATHGPVNREYTPLNNQIGLRGLSQSTFNIDRNEEYLNYPEYRAKKNMQRGQQYNLNLNNPMAHHDGKRSSKKVRTKMLAPDEKLKVVHLYMEDFESLKQSSGEL